MNYPFAVMPPGKWARVLYLHAAKNKSESLVCHLEDLCLGEVRADASVSSDCGHELHPSHDYEALSWCWGREAPSEVLRLQEKDTIIEYRIHIPPNLARALRCLRDYSGDCISRCLWVDAICINLEDNEERARQVAQMDLVYSSASNVCIWLNIPPPFAERYNYSVEELFTFIANVLFSPTRTNHFRGSDLSARRWLTFARLMMNPWFSRRWVIQEITLARKATVHCQDAQIDWYPFAAAVSLFVAAETKNHRLSNFIREDPTSGYNADVLQDIDKIGAASLLRVTNAQFGNAASDTRQPVSSLEALVATLTTFEATKPCDVIYSLLAVAKDAIPRNQDDPQVSNLVQAKITDKRSTSEKRSSKIQKAYQAAELLNARSSTKPYLVSYSKGLIDVYRYFVEFVINQSRSLDILCRPWAPDLDISDFSKRKRYKLPSWIANRRNATFELVTGEYSVFLRRENADPMVGFPDDKPYQACGSQRISAKGIHFLRRSESDQSLFVKGFVLDQVADSVEASDQGNIPASWFAFAGFPPESKERVPESLHRTLTGMGNQNAPSAIWHFHDACNAALDRDRSMAVNTRQAMDEGGAVVREYFERVRQVVFGRRLMKTAAREAGASGNEAVSRLGLVPREAHSTRDSQGPADLICILYGLSVPVVLRRHVKTREEREADRRARERELPADYRRAVRCIEAHWGFRRELRRAFWSMDSEVARAKFVRLWLSNFKEDFGRGSPVCDSISAMKTKKPERLAPNRTLEQQDWLWRAMCDEWEEMLRRVNYPLKSPLTQDLPIAVPQREGDNEYYELIGEAYVDGMMNGEALLYRDAHGIPDTTFELR